MAANDYKGIWVFAEQQHGHIEPSVFELLAKARELAAHSGEEVTAVLLGCGIASLTEELFARGADAVIAAEHENLEKYSARPYQQALTQLADKYRPSIILYGATTLGRDLAPRMMVSLNTGLTADAIDLGFDEDGVFYQTTPAYGGKVFANIVIPERRPQMVTVRPRVFEALAPDASRRGCAVFEQVDVDADACYEVLETAEKPAGGVQLEKAEVIVAGGRGVKSEADLDMLRALASALGGQVAGSRPLVESGLLTHEYQLGQSGSTVKPELIINVAVSGSVQYRVGMQDAKRIASINLDKAAPIYGISQYGIAANFRDVVPAITEEIEKRRNHQF